MILRKNGFRDILQFYMKYIYNGILARKFPLFLLDDEEKDALISKEKAEFDDYYLFFICYNEPVSWNARKGGRYEPESFR